MRDIINFIYINLVIVFKKLIEYKSNMYFLFVEHLFYRTSFVIFYYIIYDNFKELTVWTFSDFILFFIIVDYIIIISGVLYWRKSLFVELTSGQFNLYLTRPVKIFLNYFFSNLSEMGLMFIITNTLINIVMIWYFKIRIINILFGLSIFLLCLLIYLFLMHFFQSLEFKYKRVGTPAYRAFRNISNVFLSFPSFYFKDSSFKDFLLIFPSYVSGYLLVSIFKDYYLPSINEISFLLGILFITIIFIWINWKLGLKKYEAYG